MILTKNEGGVPLEILMIDDNPGDVRLAQEAIKKLKIANSMHYAKDGVEGLEFLRRKGAFTEAPRPHLILLDLNMPRMGGREVLEELKQDESLKSIPIVVLTSSDREEDILKSYKLHANCYITKPVGLAGFTDIVGAIDNFWFSLVELPASHS